MGWRLSTLTALLLWAPGVGAQPWTLTWTNPDSGQLIVDSTVFECSGGPPISELRTIQVWLVPIGGEKRLVAEIPAVGREGLTENWTATEAGHYYLIAVNPVGPGCAGNSIYLGPITGVPLPGPPETGTTIRYYDVFGRRVNRPTRSGIYWKVVKGKTTKIVYLK